jgi:hypothetical protein
MHYFVDNHLSQNQTMKTYINFVCLYVHSLFLYAAAAPVKCSRDACTFAWVHRFLGIICEIYTMCSVKNTRHKFNHNIWCPISTHSQSPTPPHTKHTHLLLYKHTKAKLLPLTPKSSQCSSQIHPRRVYFKTRVLIRNKLDSTTPVSHTYRR